MPSAVADHHAGPAGGLHPVRLGDEQDPCPADGSGTASPDSRKRGRGQGLQQPKNRAYLRQHGIRHVIPKKRDQEAGRLRRGARGGRPPGFDKGRYKKRSSVERAINKLKQFRAVATRYEKRGSWAPSSPPHSSSGSDHDRDRRYEIR